MPKVGVLPWIDGHRSRPPASEMNARADTVTVAELESAINRARAAHPASGAEASLTLEVATLAALYGRLIWARRDAVELESLTDAERVALRLWRPPAGGAGPG
ncbi:MAG: hypothetical protein RJA99_4221 [Pseudomonadota bacterium]